MNTREYVIKHPLSAAKKLDRLESRVDEQDATIAKLKEAIKTHKGSFIGDDKQGDIVPEDDRLWAVLEADDE